MFCPTNSQQSARDWDCSHSIPCILSILVIIWIDILGSFIKCWVVKLQKRAIRAIMQVTKTTSCKQYFKSLHVLPLPCLYIYETLVCMKSNSNTFITNANVHSYNTRRKEDLYIVPCNTSLCKNNLNNLGLRLLNHLPQYIKEIPALCKFKITLKTFLFKHCFYSIDEFLSYVDKT